MGPEGEVPIHVADRFGDADGFGDADRGMQTDNLGCRQTADR